MKLTKEEFDSLYSDDITKKRYDKIIEKIDERFAEIVNCMSNSKTNRWFDYDNDDYEYDHNADPYFDPEGYKEWIGVQQTSSKSLPEPYDTEYGGPCFPTRWLYEDFIVEFLLKVRDYKIKQEEKKAKAKKAREALKVKKAEMKIQIKAKLTNEELKFIKFK